MEDLQERSPYCVLECDGPGHADHLARACRGLALVVVRSYSAYTRAEALGAPAVVGLQSAKDVMGAAVSGPVVVVVSDRAIKYAAGFLARAPELVVFDGIDTLFLPNCPDLGAGTVWMTKHSVRRVPHRGWAASCYREAVANDAVIARRGRWWGGPAPADLRRHLYHDWGKDESEPTLAAVCRGDAELAVRAFPGAFERMRRDKPDEECPICYEPPRLRVTTNCCGRDFCLACAAKATRGGSCPWCRRTSGLWNCSIEPGHTPAPFKDLLLADLVRALAAEPGARVLVVTTEDTYTYRNDPNNPLAPFSPAVVLGTPSAVASALKDFASGKHAVAVTHADRMFGCGLTFPATHVVFTERDACAQDLLRFWCAACPGLAAAHRMASVVDEAGSADAPGR